MVTEFLPDEGSDNFNRATQDRNKLRVNHTLKTVKMMQSLFKSVTVRKRHKHTSLVNLYQKRFENHFNHENLPAEEPGSSSEELDPSSDSLSSDSDIYDNEFYSNFEDVKEDKHLRSSQRTK